MCVLHLSEVERESGAGVDREELVQWYLEQREQEFESEDEVEYERELIGKALNKLAKDNYLLELRGDVREGLQSSEVERDVGAQGGEKGGRGSGDKIYYVVHPQVDLSDLSSSIPA